MAYNSGHAGDLQGSLPCYTSAPLRWRSGLHNKYTYRVNTNYYNFPENVPWDRNWGRGFIIAQVAWQQHTHEWWHVVRYSFFATSPSLFTECETWFVRFAVCWTVIHNLPTSRAKEILHV
jgi:hypothetical protein